MAIPHPPRRGRPACEPAPRPRHHVPLSGFLPVAQGVAAYAALTRDADTRIAEGDARSRAQIMADTMIERITGQAAARDVPIEINLVMTDRTLLGTDHFDDAGDATTVDGTDTPPTPGTTGSPATDTDAAADPDAGAGADEPAHLDGYGPVPAALARRLIHAPDGHTPMWLRRLYTRPDDGQLAAMDSRRRYFTATQPHFPWPCGWLSASPIGTSPTGWLDGWNTSGCGR